jgi:hypothetical protein
VVADIVCAAFFTPHQFLQDFYIVTTHSQGREVIGFWRNKSLSNSNLRNLVLLDPNFKRGIGSIQNMAV